MSRSTDFNSEISSNGCQSEVKNMLNEELVFIRVSERGLLSRLIIDSSNVVLDILKGVKNFRSLMNLA